METGVVNVQTGSEMVGVEGDASSELIESQEYIEYFDQLANEEAGDAQNHLGANHSGEGKGQSDRKDKILDYWSAKIAENQNDSASTEIKSEHMNDMRAEERAEGGHSSEDTVATELSEAVYDDMSFLDSLEGEAREQLDDSDQMVKGELRQHTSNTGDFGEGGSDGVERVLDYWAAKQEGLDNSAQESSLVDCAEDAAEENRNTEEEARFEEQTNTNALAEEISEETAFLDALEADAGEYLETDERVNNSESATQSSTDSGDSNQNSSDRIERVLEYWSAQKEQAVIMGDDTVLASSAEEALDRESHSEQLSEQVSDEMAFMDAMETEVGEYLEHHDQSQSGESVGRETGLNFDHSGGGSDRQQKVLEYWEAQQKNAAESDTIAVEAVQESTQADAQQAESVAEGEQPSQEGAAEESVKDTVAEKNSAFRQQQEDYQIWKERMQRGTDLMNKLAGMQASMAGAFGGAAFMGIAPTKDNRPLLSNQPKQQEERGTGKGSGRTGFLQGVVSSMVEGDSVQEFTKEEVFEEKYEVAFKQKKRYQQYEQLLEQLDEADAPERDYQKIVAELSEYVVYNVFSEDGCGYERALWIYVLSRLHPSLLLNRIEQVCSQKLTNFRFQLTRFLRKKSVIKFNKAGALFFETPFQKVCTEVLRLLLEKSPFHCNPSNEHELIALVCKHLQLELLLVDDCGDDIMLKELSPEPDRFFVHLQEFDINWPQQRWLILCRSGVYMVLRRK